MRIFLLATNKETDPYPTYPIGMAVVASALLHNGHEVRQMDMLSAGSTDADRAQALNNFLRAFMPDMVGISIRNIDNVDSLIPGSHWALDDVKNTVSLIRQILPQVPIVLGGPAVSIMPEQIGEYCQADCAVAGEGEGTVVALLDMVAQNIPLPRTIRPKTLLSGQQMATPCFDASILDYYTKASGVAGLQTKRGCLNNCLYCSYPKLEGHAIRARDPEAVVDDILRLQASAQFKELFFTDSVFNDREGHWLALVETMLRRNVKISWTAFFQPEGLERDTLALCRAAGLKAVELGTDACSDTTLAAMRKRFDFATARRATELCVAEQLPCAHFVIVGGPKETIATLKEGLDNLASLPTSLVFPFLGVRVFPETPLRTLAIREGVLAPDTSCLTPTYYFSPGITQEKAHTMLLAAFKGNRLRIYPPSAGADKMRALRALGYRGILWDTLIRFPDHQPCEGNRYAPLACSPCNQKETG